MPADPSPSTGRGVASDAEARRDRRIVLAALLAITALAWGHTISLSDHGAGAALHAHARAWTAAELATSFAMWSVMMVAMMAPAAAPMVLALARIGRAQRPERAPWLPAALFLGGYLLVWTGFSGAAALAQWRLHDAAWVGAGGESRSAVFAAVLLLAAGAYQLSPLKRACLRSCRSPLSFLLAAWRPGALGALRMGALHGAICVGCCWALMALMFVGGAMNLLWCAALMLWMLAEKVLPAGARLGHAAGVGLLAAGALALGGAFVAA